MIDERHESDDRIARYPAREPSIPETHDSIELTDHAVVVYDRTDADRWLWSDAAVQLEKCR
ncbi:MULTISPECIES: hypothetical protein [Halorussus]|uniref:DUF7331 family protein n=1 Tax=Halorussus TaxID=1070314 RepID=UPI000E217357|nr:MULTISPECIES: hypothetical protein [Halorussus]NHN61610.1 hypothetical protein [Halorussus sp. JP-T4]